MKYPIGAPSAIAPRDSSQKDVGVSTRVRAVSLNLLSRFRDYCRDREGSAILEFAMIAPMLIALLVGLLLLGLLVNNYITLTDAVSQGARAFAESTNITGSPVNGDPCTYAKTIMNSDAQSLQTANIVYTITYTPAKTGTAATLGSSCSGTASTMLEGDTVTISATYPALMITTSQKGFFIIPQASSWTLSAHTTQVVQ